MKFAILLTGHIRHSLQHKNLLYVINEINSKAQSDLYGYTSDKKEHSTNTWYQTDTHLQQQQVDIKELNNFLYFKKLQTYSEPIYSENIKNVLWGKSPLSYVGVKNVYENLQKCFYMIEDEYDVIFRLRFDYYKFDYANYTQNILQIIKNTNFNNINGVTAVKIGNTRGEDSFFFSDQTSFKKMINYIINNFDNIEEYAKNVNYYFMPEDLLSYSCYKQKIIYNVLGNK